MARYQLDDPRLQKALDELAARDTADWPEPDQDQQAQLARLLPAPTPPPARRIPPQAPQVPDRRAA